MENDTKMRLIDDYVAKATPLPTLPAAAMRILELSRDEDVDVELVADEILKDKVLTARMIRLVNSAFWGVRRQVSSVREAIVYLGLHQIRSIVLTTSLFSAFPDKNHDFDLNHIWEHGLGCAMISREIAARIGYRDKEKSYIAGLMHDLGRIILSQYSIDEYSEVLRLVRQENMMFYDAENLVLGVNHSDFAQWFREKWGFADEIAEVIACHHVPEKAKLAPELVSIVGLADLFCRVRGLDYAYPQNIQVSMKDQYEWGVLVKADAKLNKMDLKRFTLELDEVVRDVKVTVKEFYAQH